MNEVLELALRIIDVVEESEDGQAEIIARDPEQSAALERFLGQAFVVVRVSATMFIVRHPCVIPPADPNA